MHIDDDLADASAGDSSSSGDSSSVVQDPVSAQLINNISMLDYQTLSKNGDLIMGEVSLLLIFNIIGSIEHNQMLCLSCLIRQHIIIRHYNVLITNVWLLFLLNPLKYLFQAEDCKLNGNLNFPNRKLPAFVTWNWLLIRKILLWIVLSGLVACLGAIIAMVATIPKECNPNLPWYQGKVFYEIFPASFRDSNSDGTGDLKGIIKKLDYIHELGASAIRLNSIFEANNYPEEYYNVTNLMSIARDIGNMEDFEKLVRAVKAKNMSLVLDIPVLLLANHVSGTNTNYTVLFSNNGSAKYTDQISAALAFWSQVHGVNGFYLKNLEEFVDHPNFGRSLQHWKQIIGNGKILIASEKTYEKSTGTNLDVLLSRIDLIDIHLNLDSGINGLKERIDKVITGSLWSKPHYPWVHWNIGNINSERISTKHINNTLALSALEFILPGTVSIFYGDEIGLGGLPVHDVEEDFHEHEHIHNLVPMMFSENDNNENKLILPWNSKSVLEPKYHYLEVMRRFTEVRLNTPTIYLRAIFKEGHILKNMELLKTEENLVVIERWYPRRNTCVFVGNLGNKPITRDLTSMFYGGTVVAGTNSTLVGQVISFKKVTFLPNSAIILKLEK